MTLAAVPEARSSAPCDGTWLGLDFGLARIGVAVGQTTTRTANPLEIVRHGAKEPDWSHLEKLVREWRPRGFVVGMPLGKDGASTPMSKAARRFGAALETRFERPVHFFDERLTSRAAQEDFTARRVEGTARRRDANRLDAVAASIILQNWLQSLSYETGA